MTDDSTPPSPSAQTLQARWQPWTATLLDRIPLPYGLTALLLGVVVLLEQVLEQSLLGPVARFFAPHSLRLGLAMPVLTVYMVLAIKLLKRSSLPSLAHLRPVVRVDDAAYDAHVRDILYTGRREELLLLLAALALMVVWFVVLRLPYPMIQNVRPTNAGQMLLTILAYTIFAWAGLTLVENTLRFGRGLRNLARQPLNINALDPGNVLPFGRLSLRHSLTVAATILLFVLPLGAPGSGLEYSILALASLASLSALLLPLWGVHQKMGAGRDQVAASISRELAGCQARLVEKGISQADLKEVAERTEKLIELRTTLYRTPTWPFRNAIALTRVVLAALSPLLYFILNEVLRTYVLPVLGIR